MKFVIVFLAYLSSTFILEAEVISKIFDPAIEIKPPVSSAKNKSFDINLDGEIDFYFTVNNFPDYESVTFGGVQKYNQMLGSGDTSSLWSFFPLCLDEEIEIWNESSGIWFNEWDDIWKHEESAVIAGYGLEGEGHWKGLTKSRFLAFRISKNNNFYYGWFEIYIPDTPNECIIKAMSYETQPNKAIITPKSDVSVSEQLPSLLHVYPNVATDNIKIEILDETVQKYDIVLVNTLGEQIHTFINQQNNNLNLFVGDLPKGIYYVMIKSNKNVWTRPIILME